MPPQFESERAKKLLEDTIEPKLDDIEEKLDDPVFGLARLDTELDDIEDKLDDGTYGLDALRLLILDLETKLDNAEFLLKFPTDEILDDIAAAGNQTTTERTVTIAIPAGATIRRVMASAFITIMNDTATAHKIDVTLQGRVAAAAWNNYWSEDDCVGFPAVDAATTGLVAVSDVSALVTVAGDYGFRLTVNQSGGANSVHYTTQYLVIVTYRMS